MDLDTGRETELEPRYSLDTDKWEIVFESDYLDAAASDCGGMYRAFYMPVLTKEKCKYSKYQLLRNKKPMVARTEKKKAKKDPNRKIRHL